MSHPRSRSGVSCPSAPGEPPVGGSGQFSDHEDEVFRDFLSLSRRYRLGLQCRPLAFPWKSSVPLCRRMPRSDTFLSIPYLQLLLLRLSCCTSVRLCRPPRRLIFLFSTLGISASDFFCPNLATIAQLLGLVRIRWCHLPCVRNGSPMCSLLPLPCAPTRAVSPS